MRKLALKSLLPPVIFPLLSAPSFPQPGDYQTGWVKQVVDGDRLLLTNGKGFGSFGLILREVQEISP